MFAILTVASTLLIEQIDSALCAHAEGSYLFGYRKFGARKPR
jgi:hypothetical protein